MVSPDRSHGDAPGGAACSGPSEGLPPPNPNLSLVEVAVADVKIAVCRPGSGLSRCQFSSGGSGSGHAGCCAIAARCSDSSILASNLDNDASTCSNASVGEFIARDDADCASPPTIAPAAVAAIGIAALSSEDYGSLFLAEMQVIYVGICECLCLSLASLMAGKGEGRAIGIDLGTTYSCVAVWRHDCIEIIVNDQGNRTTPSYVAFTDTERLVGDAANNQAASNPINTVFGAISSIEEMNIAYALQVSN
ncbi:hypothetical protein SASPL_151529 [Salvia splendens]|uniref:Uncharacterized protein n=1 Tax=Salvia splendens TaxID=180675 RepID=A0A8X8W8S9_SALSN|nr:hypothetical protein SASPL_151529 [Salvia splendens]